jgi:hypothetical protein
MGTRGGFPGKLNLRRGRVSGLVDEVVERALEVQKFDDEEAAGE